ncbi:hypothetical protein RFI_20397, partial [Reticulomyxa filosa]
MHLMWKQQKEVIIVDLDHNKVHVPESVQLIELPLLLEKQLKAQMIEHGHVDVIERFTSSKLQHLDSAFVVQDIM